MPERYVCPTCGESTNVEIVPFLDDDGRAKVRLTCRLIVHEQPVVLEFDDPTAPSASTLTPAGGLVHDLDLYSKLEAIVLSLDAPAEYGIVEHLFAERHPDEYLTLWRRYGHVATHLSKRYTLSTYLSSLLGYLWRHGAIAHRSTAGSGRWAYNSGISAWAHPQWAEAPITSWAEFAEAHGIVPDQWPAVRLIPTEEIPTRGAPSGYWVYDNRVHGYAKIHRADCSACNDGNGMHPDAGDVAGEWLGPYHSIDEARDDAGRTGRDVSTCKTCSPSR